MSAISVYSDGGARGNPGPAAYGVILVDAKGAILTEYRAYLGETTNNVAEYNGVLKALELAVQAEAKEVDAFCDSELVIKQLLGQYRVKDPKMKQMYLKVKQVEQQLEKVSYNHVPRTHPKIQIVDLLVNQELDERT